MFDDGAYLRVLSPITSNGKDLIIKNDRVQYRESFMPLTAKKQMEQENSILPVQLRHKIEVVDPYKIPPPILPVVQHIPTPAEIEQMKSAKKPVTKPIKPRTGKKYKKRKSASKEKTSKKVPENKNEEYAPID